MGYYTYIMGTIHFSPPLTTFQESVILKELEDYGIRGDGVTIADNKLKICGEYKAAPFGDIWQDIVNDTLNYNAILSEGSIRLIGEDIQDISIIEIDDNNIEHRKFWVKELLIEEEN